MHISTSFTFPFLWHMINVYDIINLKNMWPWNSSLTPVSWIDLFKCKTLHISHHSAEHTEDRWTIYISLFPLLVAFCLLEAVDDIHTAKHPQNCNIETGGPLTAHHVGPLHLRLAHCWWSGNRKVHQLEKPKKLSLNSIPVHVYGLWEHKVPVVMFVFPSGSDSFPFAVDLLIVPSGNGCHSGLMLFFFFTIICLPLTPCQTFSSW